MRIPIVDQVLSLVRKPPVAARAGQPREDRFRELFAKMPVGIAVTTADGHWLFVNDRFRALIGYTRAELARITLHGITHPDDAKEELVLVKRLVAREIDRYHLEKRVMAKSGRYVTLNVVTGLAEELVIYVVDEVVPSLLDALGTIAVIQSDEKGIITGWNAGARQMFGYRTSQIVGKSRRVLYRDQDVWAGKGTGTLANASIEPREMNDWRVRADGTHVWVRCSIARFDHGAKKGYVETIAALADVDTTPLKTELERRKGTEESLREALADLGRTSEETMNELRIMTSALRNEIGRRKAAEEELRKLTEQVAAVPVAAPAVETEEIAMEAPAGLEWQPLAETSPDVVLRECALLQRTGTLFVSFGDHEKELFFEEGRLFSCASNDPEKFLAERLVRSGTIAEEQRQKALEIKQASSLALGRILLILGAIDETQLVEAMRAKLEDEIAELLTWRDGSYAFVEGAVPSLQLVPLRIDVDALLAPPVVYIASRKSGKVHQVTCISAKRISGGARVEVLTTDGFERCRQCFR